MKEELKDKLLSSLDKVQDYIEATEDFVVEQAPLVAQEIIQLGRIESIWNVLCPLVICIVALTISVMCIRRALTIFKERSVISNDGEPTMITGVISGGVFVTCFLVSILHVIGVFEPWFAPRVYLIHEIGKLL